MSGIMPIRKKIAVKEIPMAQSPELEEKVAALEKKVRTLEIAALTTLIFIFLLNIISRL
jgi:hypothetical protein